MTRPSPRRATPITTPITDRAILGRNITAFVAIDIHDKFDALAARLKTTKAALARKIIEEYVASK